MKRIAAILLLVAACSRHADQPANQEAPIAPTVPASAAQPSKAVPPSIPGAAQSPPSLPAPAPPPTPEGEKSPEAAAKLLERYFAAIATKRYEEAYRLWGNDGRATGMTLKQFAGSFAKYRIYDGSFGKPGPIEGAAGSAYIEFPVKVTGVLKRGGGFVLEGPMTLRRVNDVDGSTAEQRRWHIASSGLKPRP